MKGYSKISVSSFKELKINSRPFKTKAMLQRQLMLYRIMLVSFHKARNSLFWIR